MAVHRPATAPRYSRPDGIVSYLLASPHTDAAEYLTTSLVELRRGSLQGVHRHGQEQVLFVLHGQGLIRLGDEQFTIGPGDCVFIPARVAHGLTNCGYETLSYFSAMAPALPPDALQSLWPECGDAAEGPQPGGSGDGQPQEDRQ